MRRWQIMCRFRPLINFPPSHPRVARPTVSDALTDRESTITDDSLERLARGGTANPACTTPPLARHAADQYTARGAAPDSNGASHTGQHRCGTGPTNRHTSPGQTGPKIHISSSDTDS